MIRQVLIGAAALVLTVAPAARAQALDDIAAVFATAEEQIGQSVGEAALGGSTVYVTARGVAKLPTAIVKTYAVTVDGEAPSAIGAGQIRDAKLDKLRAAAKRFGLEMTVDDASYSLANRAGPRAPAPPPSGAPAASVAPKATATFTTTVNVRFTRPSEAQMPAFLDAVHDAGVETLANTATPPNPFAQAGQLLGLGAASPNVQPEVWDKASAAAVQAARREAEVLAAAGGRKLGPLRGVMLLTRTVQGDSVSVLVGARFGFAE